MSDEESTPSFRTNEEYARYMDKATIKKGVANVRESSTDYYLRRMRQENEMYTKVSGTDHVGHVGSTKLTGWSSDYYVLPSDATELGDLIEHKDMNFNVGNIFKASYRLGGKEGTTRQYDLEKIIFFAQRELNRELKKGN